MAGLWLLADVPSVAQGLADADSLEVSWAEMYRFFDEPVDPAIYLVRPGEQLKVTFVGAKLGPLTLDIDPQGRIVHQTLGVFDLANRTLAEAQSLLREALANHYKAELIEISVSEPRRVAVRVSGAVSRPGTYKGFTSHRVSEIIELAGGILFHGTTRRIEFSGGPKPLIVDLDRATYLGDNSANPCLYAGRSIHVPSKTADRVQVVGEVNRPREIEFVPGDNVLTLIELAGGLRGGADISRVTISRGTKTVNSVYKTALPTLQAGDIITISACERSVDQDMLRLFGAVGRPGKYTFEAGSLVGDVIEKADGFTEDASRGLTTLFRKAGADEWGRLSERRYPITSAVGADGSILSMTLLPGDSVYVPFNVGYVKVSGEVLNAGRYPFIEDKDAMFYIMTAGGFLPKADKTKISIYNRIARTTAEFSILDRCSGARRR
jgi:protein involved in polysaccharide export with SLBB domain